MVKDGGVKKLSGERKREEAAEYVTGQSASTSCPVRVKRLVHVMRG